MQYLSLLKVPNFLTSGPVQFLGTTSILALSSLALAQVDVDKTCATCSRRVNDSLNLKVRKIRLNQVGYLPQDPDKAAFIANPAATTFNLVDIATHKSVYTGTLKSVGAMTEGGMKIRGAFNSTTNLYNLSRPAISENLYRADFSDFKIGGTYVITDGKDTSAIFQIDPKIYNFFFETSLKFFGANRCGNTHSWLHGACHKKDGDALGAEFTGKLAGGWHDCGDHGKYSETVGYAALTLSLSKGLLDKGDIYHSVGMGPGMDHTYWNVPENQDAQPPAKGGPALIFTSGV